MRGRERTLFVNPVNSKDKLCLVLKDWTPKCDEFHLNFNRDGDGSVFYSFL